MQQLSTQAKWQPWKGVIFQLIAVAFMIIPCSLIQYYLGMWGVVITELLLLALAVITVLIKKTPLKEVFPVSKPTIKDIIGTVLLWLGTMPLGLITVGLMLIVMPQSATETATGMQEFLTGETVILTIVTVALLPPICEEALVRGTTLSFFRSLKHEWLIVLIIGVFFGILHLDPVRFGTTAITGAALAYLMVKRNNFVLPMLLHFINNAFATIVSLIPDNSSADVDASTLADSALLIVAVYLIIGCLAPLFLAGAIHLLNPGKKLRNFTRYITAGILCGVMFFTGLVMYVAAIMTSPEFQEVYESIEAEQMEDTE